MSIAPAPGQVIRPNRVPVGAEAPFTVERAWPSGVNPRDWYAEGEWANGKRGVVLPEDLEG